MNGQETRTLREMGRDAWNEWASQVLKSKANFQEAGAFALNWYGEADNDETRLWLKVANADFSKERFEDEIDFDGYIFPGPSEPFRGGVRAARLVRGRAFPVAREFQPAPISRPAPRSRARSSPARPSSTTPFSRRPRISSAPSF